VDLEEAPPSDLEITLGSRRRGRAHRVPW
jgi:hypothetical protein